MSIREQRSGISFVAFPYSPRCWETEVPVRRVWEEVWETDYSDRFVHDAEADVLCLSLLYVEDWYQNWELEGCWHKGDGVWQGLWFPRKVCALLQLLERHVKRHSHPWRLSGVSKNSTVRNKKTDGLIGNSIDCTQDCNILNRAPSCRYRSFLDKQSQWIRQNGSRGVHRISRPAPRRANCNS